MLLFSPLGSAKTLHDFNNNDLLTCLSLNLYHEARGEEIRGQWAVANVVLNRLADEKYPTRVCKVIKQKKQFSWYGTRHKIKPYDKEAYKKSTLIAGTAYMLTQLHPKWLDITDGALWYHSKKVRPIWRKKLTKTVTIGNHIFYKR